MSPIFIKIHSFVDLITNSSTEIYIQADEKTVEAVRGLVNSLLTLGGGAHQADDLFTFGLETKEDGVYVKVAPKEENGDSIVAAKILSNLTSLFYIDG